MEYFQESPNDATAGSPSLYLTYIEQQLLVGNVDVYSSPSTGMGDFTTAITLRQYIGLNNWYEKQQYYGWNYGFFNEYLVLNNINEMIKGSEDVPNMKAVGKLLRSIFFYQLTNTYGDIPYSQSIQLISDNNAEPVYDTQEDVYVGILKELEEANGLISMDGGAIGGDFFYNGDILKWKKFINSYKLRVLLSLSNKTGNSKVNPKAKFAEMMNDPQKYQVFTSNADNARRACSKAQPSIMYGYSNAITNGAMEKSFVDSLKVRKDPRLFWYADITDSAKKAGMAIDDFRSYVGLPGSAPNVENTGNLARASRINSNYLKLEDYEPILFLGYYEVNFLIAEGIARNWWTGGNIETYYNAGIWASMEYYKISSDKISAYLLQSNVKFNPSKGLEMILVQKYLASFLNSGLEPFYSQRRSGIPTFDCSGAGVTNHKIALRWNYPANEFLLNKENVEAAVTRQFPGGEDIYGQMWALKPE